MKASFLFLSLQSLSGRANTHLSEFILGLGLDAEARDVRVREAGGVLQLFHPADLRHGLVLLLLLLLRLRGWHLHFMLLVCSETQVEGEYEVDAFISHFVLGLILYLVNQKRLNLIIWYIDILVG